MAAIAFTQRKWVGHLSVLIAYTIFGFNIIVCKDLTTSPYLSPIGLFLVRSVCACAMFWVLSAFTPREKVARRDLPQIFLAALLGFFLTQLTFLAAIPVIRPMESAMMSSLSPIYTMFIAAIALHEPITMKKVSGVLISFAGIIYLILTGVTGQGGTDASSPWGILLMVGNALFFSMYLGIFRPLIERYSVVTFMKWIFLFSTIMALPLGITDVCRAPWPEIPAKWIGELAFLVVMATFVAYFLIPLGQKIIRPTLVSMYSYAQPIVAIGISIWIGMDTLTWGKVIATLMVFGGVYIVSRSRRAVRDDNTQ